MDNLCDFREDTRERCREIINILKANSSLPSNRNMNEKKVSLNCSHLKLNYKKGNKKGTGNETYAVEAIVNCTPDRKYFLVKWENYSWSESTWEPYENIKHCKVDLKRFQEREDILLKIESYKTSENRPTMTNESGDRCMQFIFNKQLELDMLDSTEDEEPIYVYNILDTDRVPDFKYITENIIRVEYATYIGLFDGVLSCDVCYPESNDECCEKTKEYLCSEVSMNPGTFFTVCNNKCNCIEKPCPTRTKFKRKHKLIITKTEDKSWGLFAGDDIKKGDFICKCVGNLIFRYQMSRKKNGYIYDTSYLFPNHNNNNDEEFCYDLTEFANESRFINHSCDPNCILVPVYYGFKNINFYTIVFIAKKDIPFNTEITFDYFNGKKTSNEKYGVKCLCKSSNCRNFLPSNHGLVGKYWINEQKTKDKNLIKLSKYLKEIN